MIEMMKLGLLMLISLISAQNKINKVVNRAILETIKLLIPLFLFHSWLGSNRVISLIVPKCLS